MLPNSVFELFTVFSNILVFIFIGYYLLSIRKKEQDLKKREVKTDTNYHEVVDNALNKERKILSDATEEADHIIEGAKFITDKTKQAVDEALRAMVVEMQKEATESTKIFMHDYQEALKKVAIQSLTDFQSTSRNLKTDLEKQLKEVHDSLLPTIEAELNEYKKARMQQTEATIRRVVQTVAQEMLNKSISLEDHQNLLIESLEKAKKEGAFN